MGEVTGSGAERGTIAELNEAIAARVPIVLATVISTRRSVPRHAGSKMLVYGDGMTSGTIGGGAMEANVVDAALVALGDGRTQRLHFSLVDPAAGDPGVCGGDVEVYLEPYAPTKTCYVIGLGHVGQAVIDLASWLGYRVVGWDDRPEVVDCVTTASVCTGPIEQAIKEQPIDEHSRVIIVTRNISIDHDVLPVVLETPAPYIGLMGSDRRWATTRAKLITAGVSTSDLDRVSCPIGREIWAETPSEIAVSIMAEVIGFDRGC